MNSLRIVFAGTPEFGIPVLEALKHSTHELVAIYTQPDRPAGRGRLLQASAVKQWALQNQLPIFQPLHFKDPEEIKTLKALEPDVILVIAYGLILPKAVLDIPPLGCLNVHASLLPRWRGASPIQQAILQGDKQTGITIMQMDIGMDTGPMFCKVVCPIQPLDTAGSLHDTLAHLSAKPLLETLNALAASQCHTTIQGDDFITYASKITKEDAKIDWQDTALTIDRQIRAYNPWPIAYTALGYKPLRIHQADYVDASCNQPPGTIVKIDKQGILVSTGDKLIRITSMQFPGSKVITVSQWLNSNKNEFQVGGLLQ
ncbi:MAG: methionyl-tRNA formyltransferase [Legionella sp.]|nr:methionyl-tRNA formyltransferase [Legionella sp.]